MNEITTVGLDLAKNVFQVHAVDAEGATVLRKQLRRRANRRAPRDLRERSDTLVPGDPCSAADAVVGRDEKR